MFAVLPSIGSINAMDHLQRIRRLSGWLVLVCWVLVVLLPVAWLGYWMTSDAAQLALQAHLPAGVIQPGLPPWQRVAAAAANAVPMACVLLGVWQVKRCFTAFAQGQVFTAHATAHLRRFAGWTAAAALAAIVSVPVISVLLTLHNLPGERQLVVSLSSEHVFTLFFAALVWLMADIMGQGQALAEENESFV
ncbi:MAG: hypothetical protein A2496_11065 [Burkholderiales bacterium RIFOXYC12_FULL_60_6]|nr:MAG: hypothetical protein A2496_11065 [Burkholderiales bacterium RIFOXYC12_FULL_60_6]